MRAGYSKDHRPDLNQMVPSVVLDGEGRPIRSETWPGNTADVRVPMPIVDRLRERFGIRRVCVVADRRGTLRAAGGRMPRQDDRVRRVRVLKVSGIGATCADAILAWQSRAFFGDDASLVGDMIQ